MWMGMMMLLLGEKRRRRVAPQQSDSAGKSISSNILRMAYRSPQCSHSYSYVGNYPPRAISSASRTAAAGSTNLSHKGR